MATIAERVQQLLVNPLLIHQEQKSGQPITGVQFEQQHQQQHPQPNPPKNSRQALPVEVVRQIAGYLSPSSSDLRTFRFFSRVAEKVGFEIFGQRLYLHPTRLQDAVDLCASGLANEVTELVVVGVSAPYIAQDEGSVRSMYRYKMETQYLNGHPWPQEVENYDASRIFRPDQLLKRERGMYEQAYQPLLSALRSLPHVRNIVYAGRAAEPGWCSVSPSTVTAHTDACRDWTQYYNQDSKLDQSHTLRVVVWSDAEMVTGLMMSLRLTCHSLDLQQVLPGSVSIRWPFLCHPDVGRLTKPLSWPAGIGIHITRATLTLPSNDHYHRLLLGFVETMDMLKELEWHIKLDIDELDPYGTLRSAPEYNPFPHQSYTRLVTLQDIPPRIHLRTLTIISTSTLPDTFRAGPFIQTLQAHQKSLRVLKLRNVLFTNAKDEYDAPDMMRAIVVVRKYLDEQDNLELAEWTLKRIPCRPGCTMLAAPGGLGWTGFHSPGCSHYLPFEEGHGSVIHQIWGRWATFIELDPIMRAAQIPLDADGWWRYSSVKRIEVEELDD